MAIATSPALSQTNPYVPPDRDLWEALARALDELPMSKNVHLQIDNILATVQREALARKAKEEQK